VTSFLGTHGGADGLADNTVAVLEYPRALAVILNSTLQPSAFPHRYLEVLGTAGTLLVKPIEPPALLVDLARPAGPYRGGSGAVPLPEYRRYVGDFAELAAAVRGERPLSVASEEDRVVQESLVRACGNS
jgi:predicted dehydrogenase